MKAEKSWDEVVKEDTKKRLVASMMHKTETSGDDVADCKEWYIPVNWEEEPAIKAERRRRRCL